LGKKSTALSKRKNVMGHGESDQARGVGISSGSPSRLSKGLSEKKSLEVDRQHFGGKGFDQEGNLLQTEKRQEHAPASADRPKALRRLKLVGRSKGAW